MYIYMHAILNQILNHKRIEIKEKKTRISLEQLKKRCKKQCKHRQDFRSALLKPIHGNIGLIAEIKLASPSAGILDRAEYVGERARSYMQAGADAISVVVDKKYFGGNLSLISVVKQTVDMPVLCKDFVIDAFQLLEAKRVESDAILLIAKILAKEKLADYVTQALNIGLEPVVEVQTDKELADALETNAVCIAVNARNLEDFSVDIDRACKLMQKIPKGRIALGFSGISSGKDVVKYKTAGVKAVLVGTRLMKAKNINNFIASLFHC